MTGFDDDPCEDCLCSDGGRRTDDAGDGGANGRSAGDRSSSSTDDPDPADGPDPNDREPSIYERTRNARWPEMHRRDYAKALATVGGITALASLAAPLSGLTQTFERQYTGPIYSDGVSLIDADGQRIEEGRLSEGEVLTVFPEPRPGIADAPTLLVRFPEDQYGGGTNLEFTVGGYAAYSKVCTHAGCMVDDVDGTTLVCPCHSGRFNPLSGASVTGGPPPRRLPQLPITLSSDGFLIATGDFAGSIGPGGE